MVKKLKDAPEKLWEYKQDAYETLTAEDVEHSEMEEQERRFIHGLIQYVKPKRVLEVGVAEGVGSLVILNALEHSPDSTLTSIDIDFTCWNDKTQEIGFACKKKYPNHAQWQLHLGKDPSELMDELGKEGLFDLVIIDTAHIHPIESLNFLCVLPYLTKDCFLILHDIGLYANCSVKSHPNFRSLSHFPVVYFASKLLFDTISAEKRILPLDQYPDYVVYPNLGALQICPDTHKYLGNVFSMLNFPWGFVPDSIYHVSAFLQKHYSKELHDQFLLSLSFNKGPSSCKYCDYFQPDTNPQHYGAKKLVLYGYGGHFIRGLQAVVDFSIHTTEIWDKNPIASAHTFLEGETVPVCRPCFDSNEKQDILLVLTLDPENKELIEIVKQELKGKGFPHVYHFLELTMV